MLILVIVLVVFGMWRSSQNVNTGQQIITGVMSGKQNFNYGKT